MTTCQGVSFLTQFSYYISYELFILKLQLSISVGIFQTEVHTTNLRDAAYCYICIWRKSTFSCSGKMTHMYLQSVNEF